MLGDDEKPFPNWPGRMMKCLPGSSGRPSAMKISRAWSEPPRKLGNRIVLSFEAFRLPCVVYARRAFGIVYPDVSRKLPRSKKSMSKPQCPQNCEPAP